MSNKTSDSPSSKIIFKKNLGAYETFIYSYLGASSCRKSKFKAAKYINSSFKNRHQSSYYACSSSSSSSKNRNLTSNILVNGEPFHTFSNSVVWFLIAILLLCLSTLKLLRRPFNEAKHLHTFILKQGI